VDGTNIYWMNGPESIGAGSVMKMPLGGGIPIALVSRQLTLSSLAVDATSVYFTAEGTLSSSINEDMFYNYGTLMKLTPK
jgi:hypothetical protein